MLQLVTSSSTITRMVEDAIKAQARARAAQKKAERLQNAADVAMAACLLELASASEVD